MGIKVKRNLGKRIYNISNELNIPRTTVERIIRVYIDGLAESAIQGEIVVIDNIMYMYNHEGVLRGRVSDALKRQINNKGVETHENF